MSAATKINKIVFGVTALGLMAGCAVFEKKDNDEESSWIVQQFEKDGAKLANRATIAYSRGEFKKVQELVSEALKDNPRNQQALLVGALAAEKLGRFNRARQYYEDLIIINGSQTSVLGSENGNPEKISAIAKRRLRTIAVKQSELVIEDKNGTKVFNISEEAGKTQSRTTIDRAMQRKPAVRSAAKPQIGALFTPEEQNIISRFLVLKELAEKDLITKEEFLSRRQANVGGLLPLTHRPPAAGVINPVPSPELIIERIDVLKDAVENRAITPREFSAERDVIIEALLPPNPRERLSPKAPSRDILGAAKDLRKLEVLYDLNLITGKEKTGEQKAVERYLGLNRNENRPADNAAANSVKIETKTEETQMPAAPVSNIAEKTETAVIITPSIPAAEQQTPPLPAPVPVSPAPQNIVPAVSSPF